MKRDAICREDARFPAALAQTPGAPRVLYVTGGLERLGRLLEHPVVAVVGSRKATDYGMETARGIARGLAAGGVTILSGLADGIPAAAHMGALEVNGPTVTVLPGGADVCYPASRRALYERLVEVGCAVSEQPWGQSAKRWSHLVRTRIVVGLARMVIVVEAEERPGALAEAGLAEMLGRTVAAVPGRVSSPVSRGPHALLARGARLVRGPEDALDALYGVGANLGQEAGVEQAVGVKRRVDVKQTAEERNPLAPLLNEVLEQVGGGRDTLTKLVAAGCDPAETIVALAELELTGLLVRGDGGRYLPRA